MLELGVHDDGDAALLGEGHRALDHPLRQRALVVVLDEHRIGVRHGRVQLAEQLVLGARRDRVLHLDRKSTRLNSSHTVISYAVFCLKKKKKNKKTNN